MPDIVGKAAKEMGEKSERRRGREGRNGDWTGQDRDAMEGIGCDIRNTRRTKQLESEYRQ